MTPRAPKDGPSPPRPAPEGPRAAPERFKRAQKSPDKAPQEAPKRAPGEPQETAQGGPRAPQDGPKEPRQEPPRFPVKNHSGDSGGLRVAGCFPGKCRRAEKADREKATGGSAVTFFLCASRRPPKGPKTAQQGPTYPGRPLKRLQTKEGARIRKRQAEKKSPEALR